MTRNWMLALALGWCTVAAAALSAAEPGASAIAPPKVTGMAVKGSIEGANIGFSLTFEVETFAANQEIPLAAGDIALENLTEPAQGYTLRYERKDSSYVISFPTRGKRQVSASFAARAAVIENGAWRQAGFTIPATPLRELEVTCDRADLEVVFPDAMRLDRQTRDGKLVITAVMGPRQAFAVRWKPQLPDLDAKLVFSTVVNTIATARAGTLRVDDLIGVDIAQGKLTELTFVVPKNLSITQVRGENIRDWRLVDGDAPRSATTQPAATQPAPLAADSRRLVVVLNRPQTSQYVLQILAEMALGKFPLETSMPMIQPEGAIRCSGQVAVGTDSAIQLLVKQAAGLAQMDNAAFVRAVLKPENPRPLPAGKAFFYNFASSSFAMVLGLDDIVPAVEAAPRLLVNVKEDDLTVEVNIQLDVREAPIRSAVVEVPGGFLVAAVGGALVDDYVVRPVGVPDHGTTLVGGQRVNVPATQPARQEVEFHFRQPLMGPTLIGLRLELGKGPLGREQRIEAPIVRGARNQRGYLVLATEEGVQLQTPVVVNLRDVQAASLPIRVPRAQFAYRFREPDWSLQFLASKRLADIRAETFELLSLGDGVVYGSAAVSYYISGSPVDELKVRVDPSLENVEFVGRDIRGWPKDPKDPTLYTVRLQRRVIGNYNLGVSYARRYDKALLEKAAGGTGGASDGSGQILVGGVDCDGVASQTGYIAVASDLNVQLSPVGTADTALMEIDRDEIPANYRLLINAPVLRSYKYMAGPHRGMLGVGSYAQGTLLPMIVEVADLSSQINVASNGDKESATLIRYKIKNSSSQFLLLTVPDQAQVWQIRLIERDAQGQERPRRVSASQGKTHQEWLVPLERKGNPNDPITIEVELGQKHPTSAGAGGGTIAFVAPRLGSQSNFASWTIKAPMGWALKPADSAMVPEPRQTRHEGFGRILQTIGAGWAQAAGDWLSSRQAVLGFILAGGIITLTLIFNWRFLPAVVAVLALALALWVGVEAANSQTVASLRTPDDLSLLAFTDTVTLNNQTPPTVEATMIPVWKQHATWGGMVIAPILAGVALLLALFFRRQRVLAWGLLAVTAAAGAWALAQYEPALMVLGHMLTWGILALLLLVAVIRLVSALLRARAATGPAAPPQVTGAPPAGPIAGGVVGTAGAALLLACWLSLSGCTTAPVLTTQPASAEVVLDRLDCNLRAEKDSMQVDYRLKVTAAEPVSFALIDQQAAKLSADPTQPQLGVEVHDGKYYVQVKAKGTYEVQLKFLLPLAEAGEDQARHFHLAVPAALSNHVGITIPQTNLELEAPSALRLDKKETEAATEASATLAVGQDINFSWKPRARQTKLETTTFFAEVLTAVRFDVGLIEARHRLRFQIAQGELKDIRIALPANMTVISVDGAKLGAWRFDPATHELEAHLREGVIGEYSLMLATQIAPDRLPFSVSVAGLRVQNAARQSGTLGLLSSSAVHLELKQGPQAMNVDDFARDAANVLTGSAGYEPGSLRYAFRMAKPEQGPEVQVVEVLPEIRSDENSVFTVADERLVYNADVGVEITKAGVFGFDLRLPEGYDIDALVAPEISHWDDTVVGGQRIVQVHLARKTLGRVTLKLTLSRSVAELPRQLNAPGIEVVGSIKHTGLVRISSDRSVRLAVGQRDAVSEVDPIEVGVREPGALVFRLLRPQWLLQLQTEVIEPRINVDFLHVARVSEGLVRHTHYLRYHLFNAGAKVFELQVPKGAIAVQFNGPDITKVQEVDAAAGRYRVELSSKWYEGAYPLTVQYETRFDRAAGQLVLGSVKALGTNLQRGYVVVRTSDRVELEVGSTSTSLERSEPRSVPTEFRAGDLSDAVFCFVGASSDYTLGLSAKRHDSAALLEADVTAAAIQTVVAEGGQNLSRVQLQLRVLTKRYLEAVLPKDAQVWSLLVNGRATPPSRKMNAAGEDVLLIPLAQAASRELAVIVELVYVAPAGPGTAGGPEQSFLGPRFDLPLKNVKWTLLLPPNYQYDDFGGTLILNRESLQIPLQHYGLERYELQVASLNEDLLHRAKAYYDQSRELASSNRNATAKIALSNAFNYSVADPRLNEDTRVQLNDMSRAQAVAGLVGSRNRLRAGNFGGGDGAVPEVGEDADVQKIRSSLSKADSDNLDVITQSIVDSQGKATAAAPQLMVSMPWRGKVVQFERTVQVQPDTPMEVSFRAQPMAAGRGKDWAWMLGLAAIVATALALVATASWRPARRG